MFADPTGRNRGGVPRARMGSELSSPKRERAGQHFYRPVRASRPGTRVESVLEWGQRRGEEPLKRPLTGGSP